MVYASDVRETSSLARQTNRIFPSFSLRAWNGMCISPSRPCTRTTRCLYEHCGAAGKCLSSHNPFGAVDPCDCVAGAVKHRPTAESCILRATKRKIHVWRRRLNKSRVFIA